MGTIERTWMMTPSSDSAKAPSSVVERRTLASLSELILVDRVKSCDHAAFEELCRRHEQQLFRTAIRIVKNKEDAEDAVQETFLKAYRKMSTFQGNAALATWLTSIAVNTCLMILRKKRKHPHVSLDESRESGHAWIESLADPSSGIEDRYVERQRNELLSSAISRLKPKLRSIVEDHQYNDFTMAELASRSNLSIPAAKSRLLRARVALRKSRLVSQLS
jgi:RNA polymerase sigma-70 factor, ECF subfamily